MKNTLKRIDLCLINQLILSVIVLLIGVVVTIFKSFGLIDIVLYISLLFYIYSFFSILLYFIRRKEGDYELLLLSLINIITATFMFVFKKDNPPMILGAAMTIYTILLVINRGVKILKLKSENNFMWVVKFLVTFLIAFLGMLTTYNLFNEVTVQTLMFGFYFMSLGFMTTIENLIEIFITDTIFKKILSKILEDENVKLEEIIEIVDLDSTKSESKPKTVKVKKEASTVTKKAGRPKKETKTKTTKKEETPTPRRVGRPRKSDIR